jgi:MFS family permease
MHDDKIGVLGPRRRRSILQTSATTGSSRPKWVYSVLPASLAAGPLGTLVQLYLIQLNGQTLGTIYAGLAVALFNGVSIPASMIWGYTTDRFHIRKTMIASSYLVSSLVLFSMVFESSTSGVILAYSAFSLFSAAAATPLNLLIMESERKGRWADTFARLSMMSSVGTVAGLVLSAVWVVRLPLLLLSLPLGAFALFSAALSAATIREPPVTFERGTIIRGRPSFFARFLSSPLMFISIPRLIDFRRIFRGLRYGLSSYLPLFYLSTICFYLASGMFNTSFVPAMTGFSFSSGSVFAVILSGMVVQTVAFQYVGKYIVRRSLTSTSITGLVMRGGCYVLIGVAAALLAGPAFLLPVLVLYPFAAGIAFAVYYTSANTMMFNTVQTRSPGSALGVYSAVVGFATLSGSLVSGFISVDFGFYVTFVLAGLLVLSAAVLLLRIPLITVMDSPD